MFPVSPLTPRPLLQEHCFKTYLIDKLVVDYKFTSFFIVTRLLEASVDGMEGYVKRIVF